MRIFFIVCEIAAMIVCFVLMWKQGTVGQTLLYSAASLTFMREALHDLESIVEDTTDGQ